MEDDKGAVKLEVPEGLVVSRDCPNWNPDSIVVVKQEWTEQSATSSDQNKSPSIPITEGSPQAIASTRVTRSKTLQLVAKNLGPSARTLKSGRSAKSCADQSENTDDENESEDSGESDDWKPKRRKRKRLSAQKNKSSLDKEPKKSAISKTGSKRVYTTSA